MNRILIGLLILCGVAVAPVFHVKAVQVGRTNYGCDYWEYMAHYNTGFGTYGCTFFQHGANGRKLRNIQGIQGGDPVDTGMTYTVRYSNTTPCPVCAPPAGNTIALEGNTNNWLNQTKSFGIYDCDQ